MQTPHDSFRSHIIRTGKITLLLAVPISFIPPMVIWMSMGIAPDFGHILAGLKNVVAAWFVLWLIEPISYFPLLGVAGTYNAWLAGNIVNLRVPCAAIAQQAAGVKDGTKEGEVVATLGLCASVFVNIVVLILFAVIGNQFLAMVSPVVKTSFTYTLPAVMGAMIANFAFRNLKVGALAFAIACLVYFSGIKGGLDLLLIIFPTIFISIFLYRRGWI